MSEGSCQFQLDYLPFYKTKFHCKIEANKFSLKGVNKNNSVMCVILPFDLFHFCVQYFYVLFIKQESVEEMCPIYM